MIKRFFKDSAIYSISGLLSKGIAIFLVPFYTRIFSPTDYGIIDILSVAATVVTFSFGFEITQAVARFYPDTKNEDEKKLIASIALWFTLFFYSIFLLIAFTFSEFFTFIILDNLAHTSIFKIWTISIFFGGLYYLLQNQLKWRLEPKKFAIVSITHTTITISLTIILVLFFRFDLYGVFIAKAAGSLCAAALSYIFSIKDYKFIFNFSKLKEMLKYSTPLVPSSAGVFFLNYAHRILIKVLLSLNDLGLFGVGSKLTTLLSFGLQGFQGSLTPLIISKYREEDTPAKIAQLFRYFTFGALSFFLIVSVFAKEILVVFTAQAYYSAYSLVPFLILDKLFFAIYVFAPGLSIKKKTSIFATINIIAAVVNITISFIGIKLFGLIGAAIGTMISSIFMFISNMYYSQKYYFVPHRFLNLISGLLLASVLIIISYVLTDNLSVDLYLKIMIKVLIILLGIGSMFIIGIIKVNEINSFFKVLNYKKIK